MRPDVVFTASAAGYFTKASDGALEDGDVIGIFAMDPLDVANVKGTVAGRSVTPQVPVKWELNQKKPTRFAAYMPYDGTLASWNSTFYVKPDQSVYSSYAQSDLRYSVCDAKPESQVDFLFQHALSKLVVVMGDGEAIKSVTTGELALNATLNLVDGSLAPGNYKGPVTLGKAVEANGGRGFVGILVPQSGTFPLNVTLESGQTIQATLADAATLESGVAYLATVGQGDGGAVRFTLSVIPWGDGGQMSYGKPKQQ